MKNAHPAAADYNTVLDDIAAVIGLRATMLLAGWWGGKNIVVPALRPEKSQIARVIGIQAAEKLSAAYGGEQIFIPRMNWMEEIRRARAVYALMQRGLSAREVSHIMALPQREVVNLYENGRYANDIYAHELAERQNGPQMIEPRDPEFVSTKGGPKRKTSRRASNPAAGTSPQ